MSEGKITMGYGRFIGYVGALAVALGVGAAVATTPGIAYALPEDQARSPRQLEKLRRRTRRRPPRLQRCPL
jgi:hypothetical protein